MKSSKLLLSNLLAMIFCLTNYNITLSQTSLFENEKFVGANGDTLLYRQLVSDYDEESKYPLVIFLHGSGERGNDNEAQLKWGVANFATSENMKLHPSIVIAPQCPENEGWANFSSEDGKTLPTPSKSMVMLKELIDNTIKNLPVDVDRIYITGLSIGGFGTFDAISRYPDLFAAAVPVCGGGDVSKAELIAHVPMWIFHGAKDATVDPAFSRNMVNELIKFGAKPGLTIYPEVGHFSWIAAYSDPMMMEWLFKQHK